jgi:hypothetical protein
MPMPRRRGALLVPLVAAAQLAAGVAQAQVNDPRFRDYFLVGEFGEVCTMCEVAKLCQAGETPPPADVNAAGNDFTLYLLHTRTFWSQVSTIWDWFISNFSSTPLVGGHDRPVTVYTVANGTWAPPALHSMHISLEPGLLAMDDGNEVDRVNRRWQRSGTGEPLGYCARLPLWDTLSIIDARAPRGAQP